MDRETATQEIKARIDIVDVIGRYISLERSGRNFKGLCPFHQEKTPSFNVNPEKQFYYCFGCHAKGDIYNFLMEIEGWEFNEALDHLAKEAGITIEGKFQTEENYNLLSIMEEACKYFESCLKDSKAESYLKKRGLDEKSIKKFRIGYAPEGWQNLQEAGINGSKQELLDCGLIQKRRSGEGHYDRFRDRVIFPIFDLRGRVIAFGARALGDAMPKYLNSPEGVLFHKKKVLYGWHLSKEAIRTQKTLVLVEGYLDVISCHKAGIDNVVASMGTALTEEQIEIFVRQADKVVLAFDADDAGKSANQRGVVLLLKRGLEVLEADFPPGFDPDDLYRQFGAKKLKESILHAESYLTKVIRQASMQPFEEVGDKTRYLRHLRPFISAIPSRSLKEEYLHRISEIMNLSYSAVIAEVLEDKSGGYERRRTRYNNKVNLLEPSDLSEKAYYEAELDFVATIFSDPSYINEASKYDFTPDWLHNEGLKSILKNILLPLDDTVSQAENDEYDLIRDVAERIEKIDESRFEDCLRKLAKRHIYKLIDELIKEMSNSKLTDFYLEIIYEYRDLLLKIKKFYDT